MPQTPATGRDLHVDVPLSNVLVDRRPEGFIADALLPVTPVNKQSDLYYKFFHGLNRRFRDNLTLRAPGTRPKKIHMSVSSDTYYAKNYALTTDWTVEDGVNADAVLDWAESNATMLTDNLMTDYEVRVANLAANSSNTTIIASVGTAWSIHSAQAYNDINNIKDLFRRTTGVAANRMVIPEIVWKDLKINDQIRDLVFGDRGGILTPQIIANLFEVDQILIPKSLVNTATDEATLNGSFQYADIWGPHIWFAKVNLLQGKRVDTWMNAFRWTDPDLGVPFAVRRHPFDSKLKTYDLDVEYYQDEKVVSPDLAIRVANVVST